MTIYRKKVRTSFFEKRKTFIVMRMKRKRRKQNGHVSTVSTERIRIWKIWRRWVRRGTNPVEAEYATNNILAQVCGNKANSKLRATRRTILTRHHTTAAGTDRVAAHQKRRQVKWGVIPARQVSRQISFLSLMK